MRRVGMKPLARSLAGSACSPSQDSVRRRNLLPIQASSRKDAIIFGVGGLNAGGRCGGPHAPSLRTMLHDDGDLPRDVIIEYLRLTEQSVTDALPMDSVALNQRYRQEIRDNTFCREAPFDWERQPVFYGGLPSHTSTVQKFTKADVMEKLGVRERNLGDLTKIGPLPDGWKPLRWEDGFLLVEIAQGVPLWGRGTRRLDFSTTAAIPYGAKLCPDYVREKSRMSVSRNLWLALWALGDLLSSTGLTREEIAANLRPEEVGIYCGSALGQLGEDGVFGYCRDFLFGGKPSNKALAFSLVNMPAAFCAAYTLGFPSFIDCTVAACATFIATGWNVLRDIQSGRRKLAFWGGSDAALYPWSLDAFNMMSAIARDENIPRSKQDKLRRSTASRPFAEGRSGFVPGEGAIFIGLGDPETVLRLNLPILGVLRDVGRFSDGWKGSISQSGIGDYPALQQIFKRLVRDLGIDALRRRVKGLISSHGSSTPMNELYEAFVYQKYAEAYSIPQLLIQAQKSFEGHIMGGAGGGQVISLVHALNTGEITHIRNLREFHMASQVRELLPARPNIQLIKKPLVVKTPRLEWGIALSKGFGGDNAACLVEGPEIATSRVFSGKGMATRQAYERGLGKRRERMAHMQEEYINGKPMVQYDDQRAPHGQGPLETMERMRESVELLNPDELRMRGLLPILFEPEDVW